MESLFIEPASLPGGRAWLAACSTTTEETTREALKCNAWIVSGLIQVFLLLCVYGAILYQASQLIANGSELLLLVPSLRHIVGSVVLPVLGAVPDGAIVLFSGLGPDAQETLSVGVGALAGSTSMLLTIPWFLSVLAGRVSIRNGLADYRPPKLQPPGSLSLSKTGVQALQIVPLTGRVMLITAIPFLMIQGAALLTGNFFGEKTSAQIQSAAAAERIPAFLCLFVCLIFFAWYLWYSIHPPALSAKYKETLIDELRIQYIREGTVSLSAAFFDEIESAAQEADESTGLQGNRHKRERLDHLLYVFFHQYDNDNSRAIDKGEFQNVMRDMGEKLSSDELETMFQRMDSDKDGTIQLEEFVKAMPEFIMSRAERTKLNAVTTNFASGDSVPAESSHSRTEDYNYSGEEGEEEEAEDPPGHLHHPDPATQMLRIKRRAFYMMACGTALVLIFSDPMVAVMSDFGRRIGVPPFYISFILAPLASNASELLAAYSYAQKKTRKTVTISFSTLLGAAIMNNTFVLSIFMLLIAVKGLAWQFTAETFAILFVEGCMFIMSQKRVLTLKHGLCILALFPVSIALVALLEKVVGLD